MKDITTALSQEADFYPLFSEQAEQHFSPLLVVRSVNQRVQISLWNLSLFFFPLSSHRSLDKRNLTDSVLFVVSSYSPPLIIPSFGHSEAEVCYYLHPFSTLLSNLFPFFFFFSFPSWPMNQMCPIICWGWVGWRKGREEQEEDIVCTLLPPLPLSVLELNRVLLDRLAGKWVWRCLCSLPNRMRSFHQPPPSENPGPALVLSPALLLKWSGWIISSEMSWQPKRWGESSGASV